MSEAINMENLSYWFNPDPAVVQAGVKTQWDTAYAAGIGTIIHFVWLMAGSAIALMFFPKIARKIIKETMNPDGTPNQNIGFVLLIVENVLTYLNVAVPLIMLVTFYFKGMI